MRAMTCLCKCDMTPCVYTVSKEDEPQRDAKAL